MQLTSDTVIPPHAISPHAYARPVIEQDLGWLFELAHQPVLIEGWRLGGRCLSPQAFVELMFEGGASNWLACRRDRDEPVGLMQAINLDQDRRSAELTILLDPRWSVVAQAGVHAAISAVFTLQKLERLTFRMSERTATRVASFVMGPFSQSVTVPSALWEGGRPVALIEGFIDQTDWWSYVRSTSQAALSDPNDRRDGQGRSLLAQVLVRDEDLLLADIGIDSVSILELLIEIEAVHSVVVPDEMAASWRSVGDIAAVVTSAEASTGES